MPRFNLYIPANVIDFYGFINNLQSFKVIPTDEIFVWLGLASDKEDNTNTTASSNSTRLLVQEDLDI
jgi:hypothetical protein